MAIRTLVIGFFAFVSALNVALQPGQTLSRIAFGSCNRHDLKQDLWEYVEAFQPQLWIWGGDIIYGDDYFVLPFLRYATSVESMRKKWQAQKQQTNYTRFLATGVSVIGTVDDHDFGKNDAGKDYVDKQATQQLALDFFDEPADSPRRSQAGVYASYTYGPEGRQVRVILLDNRHMMDVAGDDMLGPEQWQWLARELAVPCELQIIMAGLQIVSVGKRVGEGWRLTPHSRAKLFDLVANASLKHHYQGRTPPAVLFLSGDIHMAEVSQSSWCLASPEGFHVFPLLDVTSSGLTHSWDDYLPWAPLRRAVHALVNHFGQGPFQVSGLLMGKNFATLEVQWQEDGHHRLQIDIRGAQSEPRYHMAVAFEQLRMRANVAESEAPRECALERELLVKPLAFSLSAKHLIVLVLGSLVLCVGACCRTYRRKRKVL